MKHVHGRRTVPWPFLGISLTGLSSTSLAIPGLVDEPKLGVGQECGGHGWPHTT